MPGSRIRRAFRWINAGALLCCSCGFWFSLGVLHELTALMPDSEELWAYRPRVGTEIYSTEMQPDGSERHTLLAKVASENREPVELRQIPKDLINATIAIEDRRFYQHRGVSPRDMLRAAYIDLTRRATDQGASTITQQLVRNIWLTQKKTWDRKLREAVMALQMERQYSKDEIMEMYLNQVCYGQGTFGVKAASKLYFGKEPQELSLHECAMLAGLPQSPTRYSPYRYPERCKKRRDQVLAWMARESQLTGITAKQAEEASQIPITQGLKPLKEVQVIAEYAPHFTNMVLRQLCAEYGEDTVYQGGLRVYTTLDVRVQKAAEEELSEGVKELRSDGNVKDSLVGQGALACVEVNTGRVLAMVGGVGPYEKVQYNRAHPGPPGFGRQPGSSFKPYIWACALENGFDEYTTVSADPISIQLAPNRFWRPKNYTPRQAGEYTLKRALAQSVNLVSVRLVQKLTIDTVQRFAARMLGVSQERIRPVWAMALGAIELSPLEQATGYCAFANGGLRPTRQLVRRIEDYEGRIVASFEPKLDRVIQPTTARSMLDMLAGVVESGTGRRAIACRRPCGGKTGTTNDQRDVWFVGITPEFSCAIWVGNDDNSQMHDASGGQLCAPMWARFIRRASEILNARGEFPEGAGAKATRAMDENKPTAVMVCTETGLLAGPGCPGTRELKLKPGQKPPGPCTKHGKLAGAKDTEKGGAMVAVPVCPVSGQLAGPYCPAAVIRQFPAGSAPGGFCSVHRGHEEGRPSGGHDEPEPPPTHPGPPPQEPEAKSNGPE
jgi:penicillin-binding protein 1A